MQRVILVVCACFACGCCRHMSTYEFDMATYAGYGRGWVDAINPRGRAIDTEESCGTFIRNFEKTSKLPIRYVPYGKEYDGMEKLADETAKQVDRELEGK